MTACTNNGGSRARRAVTAALVGVLSVGAAPMVALATEAAPVAGDVQVMADDSSAFTLGTVNYKEGKPGDTFTFDREGHGIVPESVTLFNSNNQKQDVDDIAGPMSGRAAGTYYYYVKVATPLTGTKVDGVQYVDSEGNKTDLYQSDQYMSNQPKETGTYAVVVGEWDGSGWNYVSVADTFTIVEAGFKGATLYEVNADKNDTSDTTFSYNGKVNGAKWGTVSSNMGVAIDGVRLPSNAWKITGCVVESTGASVAASDDLVPGTTYVVKVDGLNSYSGQSTELSFTYGQLDLSSASVVAVDASKKASIDSSTLSNVVFSINGVQVAGSNLGNRISATLTGKPGDSSFTGARGEYTYTISGNDFDDENGDYVTGEAKVTVILADEIANIFYDGQAWNAAFPLNTDGVNEYSVDLSDSDTFLDEDKFGAKYDSNTKDVDCAVTVTDEDGKAATIADVNSKPGTYTVTVKVYENVSGDVIAAQKSVEVTSSYENVTEGANIFVSFDGKNLTATNDGSSVYDGTDQASKLSVKVVDGDKTFAEGTDYTVTIKNSDSEAVTEMVDADTYTVTVKGISFSDQGTYKVKIDQRELTTIVPASAFASETVDPTIAAGDEYYNFYLSYTGEELAPEYAFLDADGNEWTLGADEYEVTYQKDGANADLKDKGEYRVSGVKLVDSKNFRAATAGIWLKKINASVASKLVVTDASAFVDVPNDAWYAEEVATAKQQGYIGGVNGTNFFAPMNNISRADMACVLYRMAGGAISSDEDMTSEEKGYISRFEDVDEGAYYAKAIAWTTKMGITNGYGTTFGISRDITTEEFVTMLVRYAEKVGTDVSVSDVDAVLAGVEDGSKVTGYAREAVAWAVEQGYVAKDGNLIDPQGSVYRARAIKIAVDYQPEQLATIL